MLCPVATARLWPSQVATSHPSDLTRILYHTVTAVTSRLQLPEALHANLKTLTYTLPVFPRTVCIYTPVGQTTVHPQHRHQQQQQQQHGSSTVGPHKRLTGRTGAAASAAACTSAWPAASTVQPGLAAGAWPHLQQVLTAVVEAVAESGVLEAACKAAMQLLGSRQQGEGSPCSRGDGDYLAAQVLDLLNRLLQLGTNVGSAMGQAAIPPGLLASTVTGPCVQVRAFAHAGLHNCVVRVHVRNMYMYGIRAFPAVHEENMVCGPSRVGMARGSVTRTRSVPWRSQGDQAPAKTYRNTCIYICETLLMPRKLVA